MKPNTVWAVCFSATGTTQKITAALAGTLASLLGAQHREFSFNLPAARGQALSFGPDDLVVLGIPVYAGRVPNLLLPYLRDMVQGGGALAVPVVLYGNRSFDDGLIELRNVMRENGFYPIAAGAFVGEHAFSRTLAAGRPDSEDMALADELARQTAKKVLAMPRPSVQPVAVEGCDPIRPYYTPRDREGNPITDFLKAKPVTSLERCTACGLCACICPMGAIDFEDVSKVVGKCIKCCACVKGCPTGAKYFDHEGYLYHQHELEEVYGARRAPSKIFY